MNDGTLTQQPAPKSAMVAGTLGILLGALGVHDWYLGNQKKAKTHVALAVTGAILFALNAILRSLMASSNKVSAATMLSTFATVVNVIAWLVIVADVVWGIIDGILLLVQGDVGLVARGYTVQSMVNKKPNQTLSTEDGASIVLRDNNTTTPTSSPVNNAIPPAPTLAEQAAGQTSGQPLVFKSSDIKPNSPIGATGQTLSTGDVALPPLAVQNNQGKTVMNPDVTRKLVTGILIVVTVIVIAILGKVAVDAVLSGAYRDSYLVAKELMPKLTAVSKSDSCKFAVEYVNSAYVDQLTYDGYITNCKELVTGVNVLVNQLGKTQAIGLNGEISREYQEFLQLYNSTFPEEGQMAQITKALDLYQVWHQYELAADRLAVDTSTDADFQAAADLLRTSGNDTLAKYGEEWLQKEMAYVNAYRAYWNTSYSDAEKEQLRQEVDNKRNELKDWVADHRPNVIELEPFTVPDTTPMYNSFTTLYNTIKTNYESHYDYDSGDCNELGGQVFCS